VEYLDSNPMTTTAPRPVFVAQPSPAEIASRMAGYGAWLEIDLDAIGRNLDRLRKRLAPGTDVMPCVKNNAYGHGLLPVVAYLAERGVGRILAVRLREAEQIVDAGIPVRVLNMGPLFTDAQYDSVARRGIVQAVYTRDAAERLRDAAERVGAEAAVFVEIDTGLRRVGVWHEEAAELIERVAKLPGVKLEGIFSTLSQSAEQDPVQLARFLGVEAALRARGIDPGLRSLASSDATLHRPAAHLDLVRPGALLYGVYPEKKDLGAGLELEQALALKARVEHVKWVERGDSVTYWGRFVAPERMRVATLPLGFSDGLPRELANKARVQVAGRYQPSLGSVSLNHLVVDVTDVPAEPGDVVEVIGRRGENTLGRVAEAAGWMVYSLLNHLNPTTPRVYYRGGQPVALTD
jgi:alanine racemase